MTSTSALLNKPLRAQLFPILRNAGFERMDARNAWSWRGDFIWVLNIRAVGAYFSRVTGWPPGSVGVRLGVFFAFGPHPSGLKSDEKGRLRPPEHVCHMRSHLVRGIDQSEFTTTLHNPAERCRMDVWWLEPSGVNAEQVARDVAMAMVSQGLPWYSKVSNAKSALELVEERHDCFVKFTKAALLAKYIGDEQKWRRYDALAESEARRIGRSVDRGSWFGI